MLLRPQYAPRPVLPKPVFSKASTADLLLGAPSPRTIKIRQPELKTDELFICLDFSQIELRVMALMSKDPIMCKVLNDPDGDIHTTTSVKLTVPRDPTAKQCNFLLIFGGGAYALMTRLRIEGQNVTEEECQAYIDAFNLLYERVPAFREECFAYHRKNGYIPLLTGRRRVIENIDSSNRFLRHKGETQLANNLIQGSAQDLMKALIIRCDRERPNFDRILPGQISMPREHVLILKDYAVEVEKFRRLAKLGNLRWRLQVHDEVLYTAYRNAALELGQGIAKLMTFRHFFEPMYEMCVAIRGDGGCGESWQSAKKPKEEKWEVSSPV